MSVSRSQFRDISEIVGHLETVPELRAVVGDEAATALAATRDEASLRTFFKRFVYADMATVAAQLTALRARLQTQPTTALSAVDALVLRLHDEYAADIGCFCPYLLNFLTLAPGEAMFLGANEPHAYLSGDCVECMACSDNVVRAGLTPKFIDRDTLHRMLTYKCVHSGGRGCCVGFGCRDGTDTVGWWRTRHAGLGRLRSLQATRSTTYRACTRHPCPSSKSKPWT